MTALAEPVTAPMPFAANKVTHTVVVVTPDMAQRWLNTHNTHNRPLLAFRVEQYARDMADGRWSFNGEPIQFDHDGVLLNGQHRLQAVIDSGLPQTFIVVRGLPPESQITMDQGTRRNPSDQLAISGITANHSVAGAIRIYLYWERGLLFGDQKRRITTTDIVQWAQRSPEHVRLLKDLNEAGVHKAPTRPAMNLAIALAFALIDERDCLHFFTKLVDGVALAQNSPILALRNRLLSARDTRIKLTDKDLIGFFVIAWNAFRDARPITKLQRPRGASWAAETFPVPH